MDKESRRFTDQSDCPERRDIVLANVSTKEIGKVMKGMMTKAALAEEAGVNKRTLRRWLNTPYMRKRLGRYKLKHRQRILPEKVVKIICEHYVIKID